MREFRFEEIAMSTRVALPMFLGCRMSELRRHHVPSPTPQQQQQQQEQQQQHTSAQAQVRRNLFGPIDHDENLKFVQNELTKISQADCKKWNFDFESEKPLQDGRFKWQPVVEGVPQAYEMPRLNCLSSATTSAPEMKPRLTCLRSSATTSATSGTTTTTIIASKPSSSSSSLLPPSVPECESTTTAPPPPPNKTNITATSIHDKASNRLNLTTATYRHSKPNNNNSSSRPSSQPRPSCSKDIKSSSSSSTPSSDFVVVRKSDKRNSDLSSDSNQKQPSKASLPPVKHTRTRSTQPSVTDFMKIRKPKRVSTTKLEDEQPPALVKRSKTTTS